MALVIVYFPPDLSSFQDDLIYTVTDTVKVADPVTYPDFKFIGDVYIGGVLVARIKKIPNPQTGVGIFNIGQIVRSYSQTIFNPSTSVQSQEIGLGAFALSVVMKFGEEYSFTDFLNVTVDSARVFFNNYNFRLNGSASSLIGKTTDFLTKRDLANTTGRVLFTSQYYFIPVYKGSTTPFNVSVSPIAANGTVGAPVNIAITPTLINNLQVLNVSPAAINAAHPGLLPTSAYGYQVNAGTVNNLYVQIICSLIYQPYMLHFMNKYGGFDSQMFNLVSRNTFDINRTQFSKLPYTVDGSGNATWFNSNNVYNETDSTYSVQFTESVLLNSTLLSDGEYIWLKDLLFSPMIYMEENGYFYPVTIQDSTYETVKTVNDGPTNLTITLKFGKTYNAQYR